MAEDTVSAPAEASKPVRRRASRAAGPATGTAASATGVSAEAPKPAKARISRPAPPPRRQPHRTLVTWVSLATVFVAAAVTGCSPGWRSIRNRHMEAAADRQQRFVDTATQTVVNMFSYNQNTIDESVNRFVNGTSGPLRDMMSQPSNVDNLKAMFRDTNASSEAVINGAALEGKIDEVAKNAAVLVSVRVTVTDLDGVNSPSQPYRLRVIVHEDDNGHMTGLRPEVPGRRQLMWWPDVRRTKSAQLPGCLARYDPARDGIRRGRGRRGLAVLGPGGDCVASRRRATSWRRWRPQQIPKVFGYDYQTVERSLNEVYPLLTPDYRQEFEDRANKDIIPQARERQLVSQANVVGVGVLTAQRDSASVMVYMNRTVTDKSKTPIYDGSRLRVDYQKIDGKWLIKYITPI